LHWRRHASSTVSNERDRFDPLADDAELDRREDMACGGGNAEASFAGLLAGAKRGRGGAQRS
jgi:hypothetical protein